MIVASLALIRFEEPGYLALLAVLPLLVVMSYRSLAGLGPVRRWLAIAARAVVVTLMILALAGAQRTKTIDDLSVVFLLDRSRSVPEDLQRRAYEYIARAANELGQDDRLGIVAFDGAAEVEQLPMAALAVDAISKPYAPDQTNIAGAARLAMALLPSDATGRIVLLSDGNENIGAVLSEAEQFQAAGVPVDVLPIQYEHSDEVVFEALQAPPTATAEETINLQMVIRSQRAARGSILLYHNDALIDLNPEDERDAGYPVDLAPGPNRKIVPVPLRAAGAHRFRAEFRPADPDADTILSNNEGRAFTVVSGQGKILILATPEDLESSRSTALLLKRALERERLVCEVEVAGANPLDQVRLLEYSAVILDNVPADDLRDDEKQTLATYVRDLGGGLIMVGGDESFGAGGWLGSPVEEVMPVAFDVKHKKQFLKGALVLVMHACEVERGNYLGERCAIEAVKTLSSRDLVGVLAWKWQSDAQGHWTVPLQEVGRRTPIINAIRQMSMGDLPDLDEVMRPGVKALLAREDVGPKHMIVVSDFDPQGPRPDLINMMKRGGITCSTIAIGYGGHFINEGLADSIAKETGGRFYRTNDTSKLPQIFIKESREIRRSLVQEGEFQPRLVNPLSPIVQGLTGEPVPILGGYVLTTARELADVPLSRVTEEGDEDPILAHWRVGLGKTVAFTSGLWPRWGPHWTDWPKFTKFWAQLVRWSSRQSEAAAFDVRTTVHGGKARIQIDAVDKNASAVNLMEIAGRLVNPANEGTPLRLTQTGPGRYEAEFDARDRGNYIVDLRYRMGRGTEAVSGTLQTGLSVAYSPEFSELRPNLPLLEELRQRAGGRMLGEQEPAAVFDRAGLRRAEARRSIWESLIYWMLLMFLVDVAIRRIAINPLELYRKARRRLGEAAAFGKEGKEAAAVLSTLKDARERVRDEQRDDAAQPDATARYEPRTPDQKASEDLSRALGGASEMEQPVVARPTRKKPAESEADYTSRLLRAKRRARDEMTKDED